MVPEEAGELNPDQLDASILGILGYEQIPQKKTSPKIHQTIARQWGDILKLGLPDNKVTEMVDKYPPIENCPWVEAPKLNPEVEIVVNEQAKKRDLRVQKTQNRVGAAITAIAQALNEAIEAKNPDTALIERLSDAGKLLAAVHFDESSLRRGLIQPGINEKLKETLDQTGVDGFLYGNNLGEKIKETKALEKTSEDLKIGKKLPTTRERRPLNSKSLPHVVSTLARGRRPELRKKRDQPSRGNRRYPVPNRKQQSTWRKH